MAVWRTDFSIAVVLDTIRRFAPRVSPLSGRELRSSDVAREPR
jgi:hypothetical protein